MTKAREVHHCRLCAGELSAVVLSLGDQPISNRLPRIGEDSSGAPVFPLAVVRCLACGLVQLAHETQGQGQVRKALQAMLERNDVVAHLPGIGHGRLGGAVVGGHRASQSVGAAG